MLMLKYPIKIVNEYLNKYMLFVQFYIIYYIEKLNI